MSEKFSVKGRYASEGGVTTVVRTVQDLVDSRIGVSLTAVRRDFGPEGVAVYEAGMAAAGKPVIRPVGETVFRDPSAVFQHITGGLSERIAREAANQASQGSSA